MIINSIKANDDGYLLECLRAAAKNTAYSLSRSAAVNVEGDTVPITPVWQIMTYVGMSFLILLAAASLVMFGISKYTVSKAKEV